MLLVFHIKVI